MAHSHGRRSRRADASGELDPRARRRVVRLLALVVVPLMVATAVALVWLWPSQAPSTYLPSGARFLAPGVTVADATVHDVVPFVCDVGLEGDAQTRKTVCAHVVARVRHTGVVRQASVDVDSSVVAAGISPGDKVHLLHLPAGQGQKASYQFSDFDRDLPLGALALLFALVVLLVAWLRGLFAMVGLAVGFVVIVKFVLPALLVGHDPLLVGTVGSAAIMFVVLYLTHGISIRTTTALLGTLFGLGVAALLGSWAVHAARLTGEGNEDVLTVRAFADRTQLSGLLLCGIVIAGLGVLNDVTVTQASAVWELHALQPAARARDVFGPAMRIGRDHIASTVYTLAFAYAGAALPVLVLIDLYQRPLVATLTGEALAEEVVSTLVGAIGLVLAVPLTTAVGVVLVTAAGRRAAPEPVASASRRVGVEG